MIISKINNLSSEPKDFNIQDYVTYIKTGVTQDLVLKIRNSETKEEKGNLKKQLPAVIFGGVFKGNRQANSLIEKTGIIGIDIDNLDVSELNSVRNLLEKDPFSMIVNVSAGGHGFCVVIKYKKTNDFTETFGAIEKYYHEQYGIVLDTACKDINRLRFISYDPDIYFNEKSKIFTNVLKEQDVKKHDKIIFVKSDFDKIVQEVQQKNIDLSDDDYSKYRALGFSISDAFGENGRDYFHIICQAGSKYKHNDCDRHYTNFCKAKGHGITLATFYHFCKEKGIATYSEETKTVIKQASRVKRDGGKKETVIHHLEQFEGISANESSSIIDQVFASNFNFIDAINKEDNKNEFAQIEDYVREQYDIRLNLITRKFTVNGAVADERHLNSVHNKTKKQFDFKVSKSDFIDILNSNETPSFNPLQEFINSNLQSYPDYTNCLLRLADTFFAKTQEQITYNRTFIKKWYVGMIGMALRKGISPLTLVLTGGINSGKTEWYRRLLPDELKYLYAESNLDAGKDDEILMTQKILIMDDEFGGKSKNDEKKFKEMTSRMTFSIRAPYGRSNEDLIRLATLCGTTNETGILNDPTGNRRIIPVPVYTIDHNLYNSIDKTELLIEAYNELQNGFVYQLTKEEIQFLNENTGDFEQVDTLEELFQLYFTVNPEYGFKEFLTNTEILARIQNVSNMKIGNSKRLGQILKKLGFEQQMKKINGIVKRVYEVYSIKNNTQNTNPFEHKTPNF